MEESGGKTDLVIQPGTEETNETTGQAADSRPAQTDQTQQSIQPEPTKPEPPREEMLTDPTKKPDGTKLEEPPVPVDHESVEKPAEPEPILDSRRLAIHPETRSMFLDLDGLRTMGRRIRHRGGGYV